MKTLNLNLHSGGTIVNRVDLKHLQTPSPTQTWKPIPHIALVELVTEQLTVAGFEIIQEVHALARGGQRYFGVAELRNKNVNDEFSLALGLRNSVDKCFPAGILMGTGVFVCSNLAFSAEVRFDRRHTMFIMDDLPAIVNRAINRLSLSWNDEANRVFKYKATPIGDQEVAEFILNSPNADACTKSQCQDIWNEWKKPQFKEFEEQKNVWRLFNAFTTNYRGTSLFDLSVRSQSLHGLLDSRCGLVAPNANVIDV